MIITGTIIAWIVGSALVGTGGVVVYKHFTDPPVKKIEVEPGKKIAVLGMQASGKTQFLKTLQNQSYNSYMQTSLTPYDEFSFTLPHNGKTIKIASGKDLGGDEQFTSQYKKVSDGADAVFFTFDIYKFKNDSDYRLQTRARLQFIDLELNKPSCKRAIIGSFGDKFNEEQREEVKNYVIKDLLSIYPSIVENFLIRDMRNRDQVLEIVSKLLV